MQNSPGGLRRTLATRQSGFGRFIAYSLLLHLVLFGAAYYKSRHVAEGQTLYQQAIMVQQVAWAPKERPKNYLPRINGAPDLPKPEAIKISKNPQALANPAKDDKLSDPKASKDRLKQMARALERMERKANDLDGSPNGTPGVLSSQGVAALGSVYAGQLRLVFQENWQVPGVIPKEELKRLACKVQLRIDPSGRILSFEIKERSGNGLFDSSVQRAVKLTPRVPLPDELLRELVFKQGILINFFWKE